MDGHFVPNLTFGPCVLEKISSISSVPLDVHLMVKDVSKFVELFLPLKPKFLSFHIEAEADPIKTLRVFKDARNSSCYHP